MLKNMSVNSENTKKAVRFFYLLAQRKGYLSDIMEAANIRNIRSLQWSYTNGKISQIQLMAYVMVFGDKANNFLIGTQELGDIDKQEYENHIPIKCKGTESTSAEASCQKYLCVDREDILNYSLRELEIVKSKLDILYKYIQIRELELSQNK